MSLSNPTLSNPKFGNNQIAGILAILLLISGGVELTVYTLQLQHSSCPLLDWSDNSASQCPPLVAEVSQIQPINGKTNESENSTQNPDTSELIQEPETKTDGDKSLINPKEIAAIAVGSTAIAALALLEIPLVVAAGAGTAIWFIARTLIDLNH
jgi:hypothetical protein